MHIKSESEAKNMQFDFAAEFQAPSFAQLHLLL